MIEDFIFAAMAALLIILSFLIDPIIGVLSTLSAIVLWTCFDLDDE